MQTVVPLQNKHPEIKEAQEVQVEAESIYPYWHYVQTEEDVQTWHPFIMVLQKLQTADCNK